LRIIMRAEPSSLAGTILVPTGITTSTERRLFNAAMMLKDDESQYRPYLIEALPTLNSDSWRVFPDGGMETTYRLKPNLTWHDGSALTADDFVFAWRIYTSPEFGLSGTLPHKLMDEVMAPDPRTVVIRWKQAYPDAADLWEQDFAPLPRHVLEPIYQREHENLPNVSFWTTDYVGAGPYRVDRWESGAYIEAAAFDGHVLGRPRIDRIRITWSADFNATLANLLSGEVDMPANDSIRVDQGLVLEREWAARRAGTVLYRPALPRFVQVQHRSDYANPQAVRDVRVRRALAHAIDKPPINEALFQGKGITTDTLIYPTLDYYPLVDRAAVKYPFDVRRSEQLMTEAGFTKRDGFFTGANGARVNLEVRNIQSAQNDSERSIIADGWRKAGFEIEEDVFTPRQSQDGQVLGTFRSLSITSAAAVREGLKIDDYVSSNASRPETRWFGQNRGGWISPEYDQVINSWLTTLQPSQRHEQLARAVQIMTDDLALIPLHFNPGVIAYATGITGPTFKSSDAEITWNIHEWEYR